MLRRSALAATLPLLLLALAACGGGEGSPATSPLPSTALTAVASATPTPMATATPEVIGGVQVIPLQIGEAAEFPDDVALIVEATCRPCDGPSSGLHLVYRDASGQVRMDDLFGETMALLPPAMSTPTPIGPYGPYIHSLALSGDASDIVVDVCTRGRCVWIDEASPDAQSTIYRSTDGGVTWEEFDVLDGKHYVVAIAKEGLVIRAWGQETQWKPKYGLFPSGEPVEPPLEAGKQPPLTLSDGELAWPTEDGRLLRSDGSQILTVSEGGTVRNIVPDASGERLAVAWLRGVGVFSRDGRLVSAFSSTPSSEVAGWLSDTLVAGNVWVPGELLPTPEPGFVIMPAIIDLGAGEAHPIPHPFVDQPRRFSYIVRAVLHGPFARVVSTGSCLNVRAEPRAAAPTLACAADDVLLRDTGETRDVDGEVWLRVVTPAGVEGWASSQYLER